MDHVYGSGYGIRHREPDAAELFVVRGFMLQEKNRCTESWTVIVTFIPMKSPARR